MSKRQNCKRATGFAGFTLIELMVAVAVVGILAAVAVPSFMNAMRKSRRSEAYAALSAIQLAQERWRANQPLYASDLTSASPTGLALSARTPKNYYALTLSDVTATGYTALATPVSGTSQVNDGDCAQLSVRVTVGNISYGSGGATGAVSWLDSNPCWSR